MVSHYTNLNFNELDQLDCVTFKMLVKDAFIDKMEKTEEGRKHLDDCWRLSQTSPDYTKIEERFGGNNC